MRTQTTILIGSIVLFTVVQLTFFQKENIDLDTKLYLEAVNVSAERGDSFISELLVNKFY